MYVGVHSSVSEKTSSYKSENSLYALTRKFLHLLNQQSNRSIDLNTVAYLLNVAKRRIYDVINVLEGLGLIVKNHVNRVQWVGDSIENYIYDDIDDVDVNANEPFGSARSEKDANLIQSIREADARLGKLYDEINALPLCDRNMMNAFVTYDDIDSLPIFKDKMIFTVKTPDSIKIEFELSPNGDQNELVLAACGECIEVKHLVNGED